jgi:methyltransferase
VRDALVVVALVFVPMLVEAARSRRNERAQRARGGVEPAGDVYAVMQVAYPAAFLAMIAEGAWRDVRPSVAHLDVDVGLAAASVAVSEIALLGFALFLAAKALKWWAIRSLGSAWTFRVIAVPGDAQVTAGPYAFLRHPNYVAVAGELTAVALMTGALVSGPIGTLAFCALMAKRIRVEERALEQARRVR